MHLHVHLHSQVQGAMPQHVLKGHTKGVNCAAISADSTRIATGSDDNTIMMWHAETGQNLCTLGGHQSYVSSLDFSKDGKHLVSGGGCGNHRKTVLIWDLHKMSIPMLLHSLSGHTRDVQTVKFSPCSQKIASASWDGTVVIWCVQSGEKLLTFESHKAEHSALCAAWSPDGTLVASGGWQGVVHVWDAITGTQASEPLRGHVKGVYGVCFGAKGGLLVSSSSDGTIKIWELGEGGKTCLRQTVASHSCDKFSPTSISMSPGASYIASCAGGDKTVKVFEIATGKQVRVLEGHSEAVRGVAWSPDGQFIVSGSSDMAACVWEVDEEVCVVALKTFV